MGMTATPTAAPCADCGTTGGRTQVDSRRPWRGRGLCRRCYSRHEYAGTLGRYAVLPPLVKPAECLGCGADHTGWYTARGLCNACYQRAKDLNIHSEYPACGPRPVPFTPAYGEHPDIPTGIITPQMLGITADEIAERCADAAYDLQLTESAALYRGLDWRDRHPEQFQPEALAALYPDLAGLAFSAWVENAEQRAA